MIAFLQIPPVTRMNDGSTLQYDPPQTRCARAWRSLPVWVAFLGSFLLGGVSAQAESPITGKLAHLTPVPFSDVRLSDPFWAQRIETNRTTSLPLVYQMFVDNGNLDNFAKAANRMPGDFRGYLSADSHVYKCLEGMAYALMLHPDEKLAAELNAAASNAAAAPRADGYADTYFVLGTTGRGEGGRTIDLKPWQDPMGAHEDYCMGHMIEAAIAHYEATGDTTFLDSARRCADYLFTTFGESPKQTIIPGHQEVELALMRLWKTPGYGKQSDLDLVRYYLDERGRHSNGRRLYGEYCQDLKPIRETSEPVGHGVRGPYMWAAEVDLASVTGDEAPLKTSVATWESVVNRKMYVTGGFGHGLYNEGFAPDYDLSHHYAYNETCAACAMMLWSQRLANLLGDGRYIDVLERVLYNGFAAGRSLDGSQLYYNNLVSRSGKNTRAGIVCCASNIVRTVPVVSGYQYATAESGVWVQLYMAGKAQLTCGGRSISISQTTNYPWDGKVMLEFAMEKPATFALHLRIPDWAVGATVSVNGNEPAMAAPEHGYILLEREWAAGDQVRLNLPMPVRRIHMDPRVAADRGRMAIARGPIIYCLESLDNPIPVKRIVIPSAAALQVSPYDASDLGGIVRISSEGIDAENGARVKFTMIPYAVWDNRSPEHDSGMEVMIPESADAAIEKPDVSRAEGCSITVSGDAKGAEALNDGIWPRAWNGARGAQDRGVPHLIWDASRGTEESAEYEFSSPTTLDRSDVYWFRDGDSGGLYDFPLSFRFQYWDEAQNGWQPVKLDADYPSAVDQFSTSHPSVVRFAPVTTRRVRLIVQLRPEKSAGIIEWRVP